MVYTAVNDNYSDDCFTIYNNMVPTANPSGTTFPLTSETWTWTCLALGAACLCADLDWDNAFVSLPSGRGAYPSDEAHPGPLAYLRCRFQSRLDTGCVGPRRPANVVGIYHLFAI